MHQSIGWGHFSPICAVLMNMEHGELSPKCGGCVTQISLSAAQMQQFKLLTAGRRMRSA